MKDACHHHKQLQRKVIQSIRKEENKNMSTTGEYLEDSSGYKGRLIQSQKNKI